ncbi:MAG TPA: hypothetical protein VEV17_00380 [Bryobacteraceae bacterium]|nr:hypothetical protein [Bryobacteraceae bacterium]
MTRATRIQHNGSVLLVALFSFLTVVNAAIACAAIQPAPAAPVHACCPAPRGPNPANCNKLGCVLSDSAPPSTFLEAINQDCAVVAPGPFGSGDTTAARPPLDAVGLNAWDRFVAFHQLRI